jgi:hypothetical protein
LTGSLGVAALSVGALTAGAATASAAPSRRRPIRAAVTPQQLSVSATSVPAGLVEIELSTPGTALQSVGLFRLREGVAVASYLTDYADAYSKDPATAHEATLRIDRDAEYFGGATVTSVSPLRCTMWLPPGRYQLFNYSSIRTPYTSAGLVTIDVRDGGCGFAPLANARRDGMIVLAGAGPDARFIMPDVLDRSGQYLVSNFTPQLNELTFMPVAPDLTGEQMAEYWATVVKGGQPPAGVVRGIPEGLAPISPGHTALLTTAFPAGRYVVASYLADRHTWLKGAFEGFWKLVDLV